VRGVLIAARLQRGWHQDDLVAELKQRAPDVQVSRRTIGRWEHAVSDIPGTALLLLEDVFGIPARVLHAHTPRPNGHLVQRNRAPKPPRTTRTPVRCV
jgi:transcriptional regulator with XRE-family HTH domain